MAMSKARIAAKLKKMSARYKKLAARYATLLEKSKRVEGAKRARLLRRSKKTKARLLKLMARIKSLQSRGKLAATRTVKPRTSRSKRTIAARIIAKQTAKKTSSRGSAQPRMEKVTSLRDLRNRAETDPRYKELIIVAASNLGKSTANMEDAYRWLQTNAAETSEEGVVDEINFVRDAVEEKFSKMRAGAAKPTKAKAGSIDPAMLERIKNAAHRTWEYVAGDTMNLEREMNGRDYVSRDVVIEIVTDANRMAMFDKEADAVLSAMDYKDVIKLMKKHVFTQARYE